MFNVVAEVKVSTKEEVLEFLNSLDLPETVTVQSISFVPDPIDITHDVDEETGERVVSEKVPEPEESDEAREIRQRAETLKVSEQAVNPHNEAAKQLEAQHAQQIQQQLAAQQHQSS